MHRPPRICAYRREVNFAGFRWREEIHGRPIWPEDAMRRKANGVARRGVPPAPGADCRCLPRRPRQARVCRQLEAELASNGGGGGGGSAQVKRYDRAVAAQRISCRRRATAPAGPAVAFPSCRRPRNVRRRSTPRSTRMERNLDALERKRGRWPAAAVQRDRARILAALDANDCRDTGRRARAAAP